MSFKSCLCKVKILSKISLLCIFFHINTNKGFLALECSFLEFRCKEVVNVVDGKRLGHIIDVVFDLQTARICGLVIPNCKSFWNVFKSGQDIFIPFTQICKIGEDTILVELYAPTPPTSCVMGK